MSLTNEQIKSILDDAPKNATEIYRDEYVSGGNFTEGYIQHGLYVKQRHSLSDLAEILALRERVAELERIRNDVLNLMDDSTGVAGLHLNGAIASWDSLRLGGFHEEWLLSIDEYKPLPQPLKENTNERD